MHGAALLIGNAEYRVLPPLQTPASDVLNVGDRLRSLGFLVTTARNANLMEMNKHVLQFRDTIKQLSRKSSVVVYFAGHGAQSHGENYLIPVDAEGGSDASWRLRALELSVLLEELCWQPDQQKLIALDACRTNGIPSAHRNGAMGLSGVSTDRYTNVFETMILYAAPPGRVANDGASEGASPFCRAFLDTFARPDRPLTVLAAEIARNVKAYTGHQQIPWKTDNMIEMAEAPFWNPPSAMASLAVVPTAPVPTAATVVMPIGNEPPYTVAEISKLGHLVHKLKAKDTTGRWAYYFVLVPEQNEPALMQAIDGDGVIDLAKFGWVLASCYSDKPTPEVQAYLKQRYGFQV
jgi:hypothetical protein